MSGTEIAIVVAAAVVGSTVKAVTGMGLPVIAIPVTALFVELHDAVVVFAFPTLLANAVLAYRERDHVGETRDLPTLAIAGIVGAVIGAIAFVSLPSAPLALALIVITTAYVVTFFARPDLQLGAERSHRLAPLAGGVGGLFQGAIGIGGPIIGSWIHSYRLAKRAHVLSVTVLFFVIGVAQFTTLVAAGELPGRIGASLAACVPVLAAIPIGTRLRDRASARGFDRAVIGVLIIAITALAIRTVG